MARTPFKLRSGNSTPFKQVGSSPAQHKKDGSWAHKGRHKTILGKLSGEIAQQAKSWKKWGSVGHDWSPTDHIYYSKEGGVGVNISKPTGYTKRYGWESSGKGDLFSTKKDPTTGRRTTKILGHELFPNRPNRKSKAEQIEKHKGTKYEGMTNIEKHRAIKKNLGL